MLCPFGLLKGVVAWSAETARIKHQELVGVTTDRVSGVENYAASLDERCRRQPERVGLSTQGHAESVATITNYLSRTVRDSQAVQGDVKN